MTGEGTYEVVLLVSVRFTGIRVMCVTVMMNKDALNQTPV